MSIAECIKAFVSGKEAYSYENYSGKCMFGKTCLGVVIFHGNSFMDFFMQLTRYLDEQGVEDVNCELEGASYDELGLDVIVYFPNITE